MGWGFSLRADIASGTNLGVSHFKEESGEFENDYIRTPLGGFINHSVDPNCYKANTGGRIMSLITLRDIKEGDELTVFYTLYSVKEKNTSYENYGGCMDAMMGVSPGHVA